MTPSPIRSALLIALLVGLSLALFPKLLGLPQRVEPAGAVIGLLTGVILVGIRIKANREPAPSPAPKEARGRIWMILTILVVCTLSSPFWLPYTGTTNLGFPQLVLCAVCSCLLGIGAVLLGLRLRRRF